MADGFSGWIPVVSSFVGGLMAITGGAVTQLLIARKEKKCGTRNWPPKGHLLAPV